MSPPVTVPMFDPQGNLRDVPQDQMKAAMAAGGKPSVRFQAPDGTIRFVPADRTQDAVKAGGKMLPIEQQDIQHPGFWKGLGSDLWGMVKSAPAMFETPGVNPGTGELTTGAAGRSQENVAAMAQADAERKARGESLPYRAAATAAQATGTNVPAMEQAAREGDVGGVLGHAAAVPITMAATAGLEEAAPAISDVADAAASRARMAATKVATSARDITPKQAAQVAGGASGAVAGHGTLSIPGAYYGAKSFGHIAEIVLGKDRANTPIFSRGATLDEATDALAEVIARDREAQAQAGSLGKLPATGAKPAAQTGEALATQPTSAPAGPVAKATNTAPRFSSQDRAAAQSLLADALKQQSGDVVDAAVPAKNAAVKSEVEFYLKKGDVAKAEAALDKGAKAANPSWTPLERQPVPSVNEIRDRIQAEAKAPKPGTAADRLDDQALSQEMNWNLERAGWSAESEARREFIARNSNYFNKSGKSRGYVPGEQVKLTRTPGVSSSGTSARVPGSGLGTGDLTDLLQRSLDEVRGKQQQK